MPVHNTEAALSFDCSGFHATLLPILRVLGFFALFVWDIHKLGAKVYVLLRSEHLTCLFLSTLRSPWYVQFPLAHCEEKLLRGRLRAALSAALTNVEKVV